MLYKTYNIRGLDCPHCVADLEKILSETEELQSAQLAIARGRIRINSAHEQLVRRELKKIQPSAQLLADDRGKPLLPAGFLKKVGGFLWSDFSRVIMATLLLILSFFFGRNLSFRELTWFRWALLLPAYFLVGWPVLMGAAQSILRGRVFNELFLMTIASIGAFLIGEIHEAVAVMIFFALGEAVQDRTVFRSQKSIRAMMSLRPDQARIVEGENTRNLAPEDLVVGDIIEVWAGERVPLDGEVIEGESWVDNSALTGESLAQRVALGSSVSAGVLNEGGRFRMRVSTLFKNSSVARILELVENAAEKKSSTEKFITRFAAVYTPLVVFAAAGLAFLPPLIFGLELSDWVHRALVMLVISCPCALVISIPLSYFAGVGRSSREGILVKGATVLDALNDVAAVAFDKTGTLSEGVFRLRSIHPSEGWDEQDLLELAARAESSSHHPVARAVREAWGKEIKQTGLEDYQELRGLGLVLSIDKEKVLAGNAQHLIREGISLAIPQVSGTLLHIAKAGRYAGYFLMDDIPKAESAQAIAELRAMGIQQISMLTGDVLGPSQEMAKALDIKEIHAGLLPEDKVDAFEKFMRKTAEKKMTAFVGDGINDAPVIMRADVGIAMGALGSDAAIEAADVVLMDDNPRRIPDALAIAARTRRIVVENIVFALGIKVGFLILGAWGLLSMWFAVIGDVGVTLLAVLNATRVLWYKKRV